MPSQVEVQHCGEILAQGLRIEGRDGAPVLDEGSCVQARLGWTRWDGGDGVVNSDGGRKKQSPRTHPAPAVLAWFGAQEARMLYLSAVGEAELRRGAAIDGDRRGAGRPITFADGQIAATARAHGATLATRNVTDFEGCGVEVINPWNVGMAS